MPQLIFYVEGDYPQIHDISDGKFSIGRNSDNDISISDTRVSVYHAEVEKKDGAYLISDLGSHNGTAVNGKLVESTPLKDGDRIKFGAIKAVFVSNKETAAAPPKSELAAANQAEEKKREALEKEIAAKSGELSKLESSIKEKQQTLLSVGGENLEELKKSADGLKRKSEIERNNLMLIHNQIEKAQQQRKNFESGSQEREAELKRLSDEISSVSVELDKKRLEAQEVSEIIKKGNAFKAGIDKWESDLKERQNSFEELGRKLSAKEKALADLDLEGAQKQKEALTAEIDRLKAESSEAKSALESHRKASEEATLIIEQGKKVQLEINDLNEKIITQESVLNELNSKIAAAEKGIEELDIEAAVSKKENLEAESRELSSQLDQRKAELVDLERAAAEASALIEKGKSLETEITRLEEEHGNRENLRSELETTIAAHEKSIEELGAQIAQQNTSLQEISEAFDSKQREAAELAETVAQNEQLIRSSSEKLTAMEETLKKGVSNLTRSKELQKSLNRESSTLSQLVSEKSTVLQLLKGKIDARKYGQTEVVTCPPIRIIDPNLRSLVHFFHHGAGIPESTKFSPIGHYSLAAATKGSIHRETDTIRSAGDVILLLLEGDVEKDQPLIQTVSREMPDSILLVSWRGVQLQVMTEHMDKNAATQLLTSLLTGVSGIVTVDVESSDLIDEIDIELPHLNVPMPYPIGVTEWNISTPASKRSRDIFVSADGFDPRSRIHQGRMELVNQLVASLQSTVTIYYHDATPLGGFNIPGELLTIPTETLEYHEYLHLMGQHHLVTGFGKNSVGGEIMSDAILARSVFLGGNRRRITDDLLFPASCIDEESIDCALKNVTSLLSNHTAYRETVEQSQNLAAQLISYETVSERLSEFVHFISANPAGV